MWGVDPKLLCDKHLRGEHLEMHMFVGSIRKKIHLGGYVEKGFIDTSKLRERHDKLAQEMKARGFAHRSELPEFHLDKHMGSVDTYQSLQELMRRCPECRSRITSHPGDME